MTQNAFIMIQLSVNLNKIALLRNSREGNYPDVIAHGKVCLAAGADGLTVHPRPDQRHIRPGDVRTLGALLTAEKTSSPALEYNIEGNPFAQAQLDYPGLMALVEETRPDQCTLVPDSSDQLTSDHGFNLDESGEKLKPVIEKLHEWGIRVSLFMDPDPRQIDLACDIGADRIELYTGPYAMAEKNRHNDPEFAGALFNRYLEASEHAQQIGLGVNAGHDLNLTNLGRFSSVPGLLEVSIGHALVVDALALGLAKAVKRYKTLLS